ncbi:hypothetical protein Hanom_Chr02g00106531 [Helianthus anomalus]
MLLMLVFKHVMHKFQFQLDSLAFSFTFRFILSSACCIHLHSVKIVHNLTVIRLLHLLVAFRYCKFRLLHSLAFRLFRLLHSDYKFRLLMLLLQSAT